MWDAGACPNLALLEIEGQGCASQEKNKVVWKTVGRALRIELEEQVKGLSVPWIFSPDECNCDFSPTNMHQTAGNIQVSASIGIREKKGEKGLATWSTILCG